MARKKNTESNSKPIDQYEHKEDWRNRLIVGDSLLVMNSLLEKEGMGGKVQMVYFDPPYGIKYGSNFQPFVNKRDVKDGKDEDLTAEPEMIKAFRDTWELGIHSYLTYLRDRLLLVRELLHESGSIFVQISDENVHLVRCLMGEVFGVGNFVSTITFKKTAGRPTTGLMPISDYIIWYAKDNTKLKYRQLFVNKPKVNVTQVYNRILLPDDSSRALTQEEKSGKTYLPSGELYTLADIFHQGATESGSFEFVYKERRFTTPLGKHWKTSIEGLKRLEKNHWLEIAGDTLRYRRFLKDFPVSEIINNWIDVQGVMDRKYVVETNETVVQRCLLMTTDPGDLVLDITCGSGTTAYVAENWGRRWITCDTSRVQ
ncbi:MAG: site-specific DNA-methyltransferase [Candidatus Brocadiaceae bacterium]